MKYTITLHNTWKRPYFYSDSINESCVNTEISEYETTNLDLCKTIVKDFLDVPESELTLEEIRKQFEDPRYGILPEKKLTSIQDYYNGRLAMYNSIMKDLNLLEDGKEDVLLYDIPYKYNHFTVEDDDNEKQIAAYIKVKIENEDE